jgi:hypothetical protein
MAYDLRMGGNVGTVAEIADADEVPVAVGFDYHLITIGGYRFTAQGLADLAAAIAEATQESAKRMAANRDGDES